MKVTRRKALKTVTLAGAAAVGFPGINLNRYRLYRGSQREYSARAIGLLQEATVVDMLGGFLDELDKRGVQSLPDLWFSKPGSFSEEDYRTVRDSGIDLFAFGELFDEPEEYLERMAQLNGFIASNSGYLARIDCKRSLDGLAASGKIGVLISFQDSSHFREIGDVDRYYTLGQRVSQLTYNGANAIGCGAFEDNDTGLTEYGARVIERMESVGMGVDLSHCGDRTTLDALGAVSRVTLFTHAACRGLNPGYARAKSDEAIRKMAATGGVIGMPVLRFMLRDREPVTIEHFLDQIDYVARLVGIEHVGVGSDATLRSEDAYPLEWRNRRLETAPAKYKTHTNDDYLICVEGINHPQRAFDMAEGFIGRGYGDDDIKMVLGANFVRALREIFKD